MADQHLDKVSPIDGILQLHRRRGAYGVNTRIPSARGERQPECNHFAAVADQ